MGLTFLSGVLPKEIQGGSSVRVLGSFSRDRALCSVVYSSRPDGEARL